MKKIFATALAVCMTDPFGRMRKQRTDNAKQIRLPREAR